MEGFIIIIFIFLVIGIYFIRTQSHDNKIHERIESIGGTVVTIERRNMFTGIGPFKIVGKGRMVYYIEYRINDEYKEGYVRFGGLLGPDWRL